MTQKAVNSAYWQTPPLKRQQIVLFETCLEDRIPQDHPVRLVDEILDRLNWTEWENTYDRRIGQPPIHPRVLCKVLLFAMMRRIRSSRQIEYNINHSIDFMWLVSGRSIDHSTISEFRRKNGAQLKDVHRQLIRTAINMKVAKLSELCIDGTRVLANANRYKTWTAARVEKALKELGEQIDRAMAELDANDVMDDLFDDGQAADRLPTEISNQKRRQEQLNQILADLNQMDASRKTQGIDPTKNPAQLPKTDLDARILPNKEGGYAANFTPIVVNEMTNGFIVETDVLVGNVEHTCLTTMVEIAATAHGAVIETVMADSAYATGENICVMDDRQIELLSPLAEKTYDDNPAVRPDPTQPVADEDLNRLPINPSSKVFDRQAFVYDEERDCHFCPAGREMPRRGQETRTRGGANVLLVHYICDDCTGCPLSAKCRKSLNPTRGRKVTRDEHEPARERHRAHMQASDSAERYKQRQHFGEYQFGILKACFGIRRFLLRGHEGVRTEWQWGCTAFNLKKLVNLMGQLRAGIAYSDAKLEACGV